MRHQRLEGLEKSINAISVGKYFLTLRTFRLIDLMQFSITPGVSFINKD